LEAEQRGAGESSIPLFSLPPPPPFSSRRTVSESLDAITVAFSLFPLPRAHYKQLRKTILTSPPFPPTPPLTTSQSLVLDGCRRKSAIGKEEKHYPFSLLFFPWVRSVTCARDSQNGFFFTQLPFFSFFFSPSPPPSLCIVARRGE